MMRPLPYLIPLLSLAITFATLLSCSDAQTRQSLDRAEALMEGHPDSARALLAEVSPSALTGREEQARYALLMSMALDKNYVDTTTFDVLQPALDYYPDHGTPDEKLRTYYYQGRIFQNRGDRDGALHAMLRALDFEGEATDSLCLARTHVSSALICYNFYDLEAYTRHSLRAADLYRHFPNCQAPEFDCLQNAYNGFILLNDRAGADSLRQVCNAFEPLTPYQREMLLRCNLVYTYKWGTTAEVEAYIQYLLTNAQLSNDGLIKLADAYHRIGDDPHAKQLLDAVAESQQAYDIINYEAAAINVEKGLGHYQEALTCYEDLAERMDSIASWKHAEKSKAIEERHQFELRTQAEAQHKSQIIWGCVGGMMLLAMGLILLFFRNQNLQLERDKKALEAENLAHRVEILEQEGDSLKAIAERKEELPQEVQQAIQVRIEMLNSLLAGYITDNAQYAKPYDAWVKEVTEDTEVFMTSNRLAFRASHPRFIQYFEDHGLTPEEINYVCLCHRAAWQRGRQLHEETQPRQYEQRHPQEVGHRQT